MEAARINGDFREAAKVLAAGSVEGHRVELLELPDGNFVIARDGCNEAVYRVGTCNLEGCTKSFLAFLQSPQSSDPGTPSLHQDKLPSDEGVCQKLNEAGVLLDACLE